MLEILRKQKTVESIPVDLVFPNPFQPRRVFDEEELFALGESIRENGLIQPVSVRKIKGGFELIAGERRLRASKLIGKQKIEAIVYEISDEDCAVWALIENLQREGLSPFDEAEAMAKLISAWNIPRDEAAKRLGIAASSLSNKLRILKLSEPVRKIILENNLTERHARELLRIEKESDREEVLLEIVKRGLNVPKTEKFISAFLEKEKPKRKPPKYLIKDMRIFINTFEHAVKVMDSAGLCPVSTVTENEESITYSVSVPKAKAFRSAGEMAEKSAAPVLSAFAPSVI
ncbi:MAG: ParB/RepB/Spo0J family partition protein [Oscillospiraceae bacterium]|nr:ParB/RepB/Spo0J family partition protein [Oscillospiraceae bacterium]